MEKDSIKLGGVSKERELSDKLFQFELQTNELKHRIEQLEREAKTMARLVNQSAQLIDRITLILAQK